MQKWKNPDHSVPFPNAVVFVILILAVLSLAGSPHAAGALEEVTATRDGAFYEVRYCLTLDPDAVTFGTYMGYDRVHLEGAGHLKQAGLPQLPARTVYIAIPADMKVTGLREVSAATAVLPGSYDIFPAQPPKAISGCPFAAPFAEQDEEIYSSSYLYPAGRACFLRQSDLAGQNLAAIQVCPLQYSPGAGRLTLASRIEVVLEGEPGYRCGDYMPAGASERSRSMYRRMLESMVANPQDIRPAQSLSGPVLQGVPPGQFDYVIVTIADWVYALRPLAEWRTKQGYRVNIVTTEWIYTAAGYSGTDLEKMRAFIMDAHDNWGTACFVLASDVGNIPYHVKSITVPGWQTDDIPNDTYYADYDEDYVLEVIVGRLSVRNTGNIAAALNKILTYEKTPPLTDYVKTALFIGMDITVCGDMDGEIFKENYIRAMHLPGTWALDTEYDAEPGTHKADILAYLGQGYHLVNHHDHCNTDCMGAGWTCHSELIYTSDMDTFTNGDRLSIFFAVGCFPAHIPTGRCIGEASLRNPDGSGVAFMGNTSYGWGGDASDPDLYSVRQDRYFYRNLFDLGIYSLGENFTRLKNDEYDPVDPYNLHQYAFTQLHLIGDPGMTVWTDDPQDLTVAHPASVTAGETATFVVEVSGPGGPIDGADVCLYKDGDIHEVEETAGGEAEFEITPASAGTLYVTVCRHNFIPYEGTATVSESAGIEGIEPGTPLCLDIVSAVPTPFEQSTRITYTIPGTGMPSLVTVRIYDCLGRRVRTLHAGEQEAGVHSLPWNGRDGSGNEVASGVYYCEVRWQDRRDTRRLVLLR